MRKASLAPTPVPRSVGWLVSQQSVTLSGFYCVSVSERLRIVRTPRYVIFFLKAMTNRFYFQIQDICQGVKVSCLCGGLNPPFQVSFRPTADASPGDSITITPSVQTALGGPWLEVKSDLLSVLADFHIQGPDIDLTVVSGPPPYLTTPGPELFAEVGKFAV